MTYQTTPYRSWIFPDEAYLHNTRGSVDVPYSEPPALDVVPGELSSFYEHSKQLVLDRIANTIKAKQGMEGKVNTTARSQRQYLPMSRSAVPNGIFEGSTMEYLTSSGLRGGRIYTKEGQEWLAKRLQQRIKEYDAISSGSPSTKQETIEVSPFKNINLILSQLFSSFDTGFFSGAVSDLITKFNEALLEKGAEIDAQQLGTYAKSVQKLIAMVRPSTGTQLGETLGPVFEAREKRLRLIDQINSKLKVTDAIVREIARTLYQPLSARQQVMNQLSSRLLGAQYKQFTGEFSGPERMYEAATVEGVEPGIQTESILTSDLPVERDEITGNEPSVWENSGSGRRRHKKQKRKQLRGGGYMQLKTIRMVAGNAGTTNKKMRETIDAQGYKIFFLNYGAYPPSNNNFLNRQKQVEIRNLCHLIARIEHATNLLTAAELADMPPEVPISEEAIKDFVQAHLGSVG